MDDLRTGTLTIASFVAATVGRKGHSYAVRGGRAIASTYAVDNAYFTTAIHTELQADPGEFLTDAGVFFGELKRAFHVWVPSDDPGLRAAVLEIGGRPQADKPPAMSIRRPIPVGATRFEIRAAATPEDFHRFGQTVEAGYASPRLGWLLSDQDSYAAEGTIWATAYEGEEAVGVACGYLTGEAGGVYYVATPPPHRGKGVGAEVTRWVVNALFEQRARCVTLQSSELGFRVYKRLGFSVCGHYERFVVQAPQS